MRYFPQPLQDKYAKQMEGHRLKREIIATAVTNSMVNRMGATFVLRMQEDTGRTPAEIARAYAIARESLEARDMWAQIDALDGKVAEPVQIDALLAIWQLMRSLTRWLLSRPGQLPEIAAAVSRYGVGLRSVRDALPDALTRDQRAAFERRVADWRGRGMPAALAADLAALPLLDGAPDIVETAQARKIAVAEVTRAYFVLGDALHLSWLYDQIEALPVDSRWSAAARGSLRDELATQQRALVGQILAEGGKKPAQAKVEAWLGRDDSSLRFTLSMLSELASQKALDYPTVSVAVRRLAQLAATA